MNILARYALTEPERTVYELLERAGEDGLTKRDISERAVGVDVEATIKSLVTLGHVGRIGNSTRYGAGVKSAGGAEIMKAIELLPAELRASFQEGAIGGAPALHYTDTAAGPNTRANALHDAEEALGRAGMRAWHDGGFTVYLLGSVP